MAVAEHTVGATFEIKDEMSGTITDIIAKLEEFKETMEETAPKKEVETKVINYFDEFVSGSNRAYQALQNLGVSGFNFNFNDPLQTVKDIMDISDEAATLQGKLALSLDADSSVNEFKEQIVGAANEARVEFDTLANSIAGIGIVANDQFTNDELLQFTQSLGTAFSLGGTSTQQMAGAMTQIKQVFSSGILNGDEFRSLQEVPLVLELLADEMGVLESEVKELSAAGEISAETFKNAFINGADKLQEKLDEVPLTFENYITRINNSLSLLKNEFGLVVNKFLNMSAVTVIIQAVENAINNVYKAFKSISSVVGPVLTKIDGLFGDLLSNGWALEALTWILTAAFGLFFIMMLKNVALLTIAVAKMGAEWVIAGAKALLANIAALWPLYLLIGIIALIIVWARKLGADWETIFTFIGEVFGLTTANIANTFIAMANLIASLINQLVNAYIMFANLLGNVFNDPAAVIVQLFSQMAISILNNLKKVADVSDSILNTNFSSKITTAIESIQSKADSYGNGSYEGKDLLDLGFDYIDPIDLAASWGSELGDLGESLDNFEIETYDWTDMVGLGDLTDSFSDLIDTSGLDGLTDTSDLSDYDASTGTGSLSTSLDEDSIDEIKALAEIQYRLNYKQVTPNVNVSFGDVRETADLDDITDYIKKIMNEDLEELYVYEGSAS